MGFMDSFTTATRRFGQNVYATVTGIQRKGGRRGNSLAMILGDMMGKEAAPPPGSYDTYRSMIRHPTIALARASIMGPIISAKWSFEAKDGTPPDRVKFIQEMLEPMRGQMIRENLRALDFGWQPGELTFTVKPGSSSIGPAGLTTTPTRVVLEDYRPLLQDITTFIVDAKGNPVAIRNDETELDLAKCLIYAHDTSPGNPYGAARLENCRREYADWRACNESAGRYDRKVAGVMFLLRYKPGLVNMIGGATIDATTIANQIVDAVGAGKAAAWPDDSLGSDDRNLDGGSGYFKPEMLEDKGSRQPGFIERLRYLDALLVRGMLRSERSVLESTSGGIGTSDTEEMQDLGLTDGELIHGEISEAINKQVIDPLLRLNFGPGAEGTVYISPAPLVDRKIAMYSELIKSIAAAPGGMDLLLSWFDMDAIIDALGFPKNADILPGAQLPIQPAPMPAPGADPNQPPPKFEGPQAAAAKQLYAALSLALGKRSA